MSDRPKDNSHDSIPQDSAVSEVKGLAEKIAPSAIASGTREKTAGVLPSHKESPVEVQAEKAINRLQGILDELQRVEKFEELDRSIRTTLLGYCGPHNYIDFIQYCSNETIERYYEVIRQIYAVAEEKRDNIYNNIFRSHLKGLVEFLQERLSR